MSQRQEFSHIGVLRSRVDGAPQAQTYPSHGVTVIVPFPAGGPSDVVARIVAEHMGRTSVKNLVIENVGGAGGTIGSGRVAAAAPDGYTLLAGSIGRCGPGADTQIPEIRLGPRIHPDRADRAFARRHRRAQGFSG